MRSRVVRDAATSRRWSTATSLFGATVAASYLHASGLPVRFTAKEAADLAEQVSAGHVDVRALATALKEWTERI
ncbi:hypothetical protein J7I98_36980 [Streptomyces sp. ISL-98]|uniref:hypothetical protein n=1 Tax=Streptomyces sp. ISL-98 TaxID=2819192 RepID=UPI001BE6EDFD|nr:hypothetical protein [Streptomyces sp. ISL-98]MBT2511317.1 hypothetical protein [Streptomyces sp. ISL-98]